MKIRIKTISATTAKRQSLNTKTRIKIISVTTVARGLPTTPAEKLPAQKKLYARYAMSRTARLTEQVMPTSDT